MRAPYLPRVIDSYLDEVLEYSGAVAIEGVKWCGKTRTAEEKAASAIYLHDPDKAPSYQNMADTMPSLLLEGDTPHLIDEWQLAPITWNSVKFTVDKREKPGQFILTGSAAPPYDPLRHSGVGRITRITMRPMSLFESGESTGTVSLRDLFEKKHEIGEESELTIRGLSAALVRGGWPGLINTTETFALKKMQEFVDSTAKTDISKIDGVKRSPAIVRELLRSLSRNISTTASMSTVRKDMAGDDDTVSDKTVSSYIEALRGIFVVEDAPAWNPSMRSKTAVRSSPKRHFVDPSIAAAVMRATPESLLEDFNTFGLLFESLCVRDLRVYSQVLDGDVFHYRDRYDMEADAIIHLRNGKWGAVEMKLGSREIEEGSKNLKKLRDKVDTERMKEPSFLMVITGTGYAYKRKDGVLVVPIGCLKD